jgi:hypothetical protein
MGRNQRGQFCTAAVARENKGPTFVSPRRGGRAKLTQLAPPRGDAVLAQLAPAGLRIAIARGRRLLGRRRSDSKPWSHKVAKDGAELIGPISPGRHGAGKKGPAPRSAAPRRPRKMGPIGSASSSATLRPPRLPRRRAPAAAWSQSDVGGTGTAIARGRRPLGRRRSKTRQPGSRKKWGGANWANFARPPQRGRNNESGPRSVERRRPRRIGPGSAWFSATLRPPRRRGLGPVRPAGVRIAIARGRRRLGGGRRSKPQQQRSRKKRGGANGADFARRPPRCGRTKARLSFRLAAIQQARKICRLASF